MTTTDFLEAYPEYEEEFLERAGIMEFNGGRDQKMAEIQTILRMREKYRLGGIYDSRRGNREEIQNSPQMSLW